MKIVINGKEFHLQPDSHGHLMLVKWTSGGRGGYIPAYLTDIPVTLVTTVQEPK